MSSTQTAQETPSDGAASRSTTYSPPSRGHRLEVRGLTRTFGEKTAVDDVSFTVEPRGMTGFIGANGAGKTTTMRMMMGVLRIHSGQVLWDGRPITAEQGRHIVAEHHQVPKQTRTNTTNQHQAKRRKLGTGREPQKSPGAPTSRPAKPSLRDAQVA